MIAQICTGTRNTYGQQRKRQDMEMLQYVFS